MRLASLWNAVVLFFFLDLAHSYDLRRGAELPVIAILLVAIEVDSLRAHQCRRDLRYWRLQRQLAQERVDLPDVGR